MYYFDYADPVFRPPSEARSLIFQITVGCSQNHCRFCGMYKLKIFRLRSVAEIAAEVAAVPVQHRQHFQRIFLADGDAPTLELINKGFSPQQMLELCRKAKTAGVKLSVTGILGLAGRERTSEHALATAEWINQLAPEYFSLLTMFKRHNDAYFEEIQPLRNGEIIEEALAIVKYLNPKRTILRSNHVSNILNLAGSYPKDREKLIAQVEAALAQAQRNPHWWNMVPDYGEEYF